MSKLYIEAKKQGEKRIAKKHIDGCIWQASSGFVASKIEEKREEVVPMFLDDSQPGSCGMAENSN